MRALLLSVLVAMPVVISAQEASPFVPLQHWAMPYVEHLIAAGILEDPTPMTRPLKRGDLVRALEAADTFEVSDAAYATVKRLLRAFRPEVQGARYRLIGDVGVSAATYNVRDPLELGRGVPVRPYGPSRTFGNGGVEFELLFGPGLAVTHPYFDSRLRTDAEWFDAKRNGLRAAEAYVAGQWRYAQVFFGILDRNWGPSGVQGLLLSGNPYALDHLAVTLGPPSINLQAVVSQLDPYLDSTLNRHMTQHRLYVHPKGRWTVAVWEGGLWSGPGRQAEPWYLNIMNLVWHVAGYNAKVNLFEGLDIERRGETTLFGQFLIDDIQINRQTASDLKPTSYGLTIGAKGGLRRGSVAWTVFYTQVANLTYRNERNFDAPLYHLLGTGRNFDDYDQATAKMGIVTRSGLLIEPEVTIVRQGEGDPRLPHPLVSDYPTTATLFQGVVQRTIRLATGVRWQGDRWGLVANGGVHLVHSDGHVTGAAATHFVGSIGLTYRLYTERSVP